MKVNKRDFTLQLPDETFLNGVHKDILSVIQNDGKLPEPEPELEQGGNGGDEEGGDGESKTPAPPRRRKKRARRDDDEEEGEGDGEVGGRRLLGSEADGVGQQGSGLTYEDGATLASNEETIESAATEEQEAEEQ